MYDWANSAYITTAVGLLPIYFAKTVVPAGGVVYSGHIFRADTLWGFAVGLAGAVSFLCAPVLGAIADFSSAKKKFLNAFAYSGALFCMMLYFSQTGDVALTLLLFLLSQVGFVNGNVFYDAFLPHIASEEKMDAASARGYAYGYVGGGLQFALALLLVTFHDKAGLGTAQAARIGIAMAGLWWAGFTFYAMRRLHEAPPKERIPEEYRELPAWLAYLRIGIGRTWRTTLHAAKFRHLVLFLLAFMLYNEGIQTVINMATIFGSEELGLKPAHLMGTLLMIQFVAFFGALLFSKIADRVGTRRAILGGLVIWMGVVIYAYFLQTALQYFCMGAVVGMTMGGTQALSRSYYGSMVPAEASAEFFGFYTVFTKFSAIWGPWTYAALTDMLGPRVAITSLLFFFVSGSGLLVLVNEAEARRCKTESAF